MRPTRDIDLMMLADGELDAAARAELEAAAATDPSLATKLEALGELREVVRGHLELAADEDEHRLGAMWAQIDKRLELDAGKRAPASPAVADPAQSPGVWSRITRWIDAYRGHVLTGALSAGAVAAVALMMRPEPKVVEKPVAISDPAPRVNAPTGPEPMPAGNGNDDPVVSVVHTPPEVESLDVTGGTGTVFTIEGDDGEQTTVIWVTPDDTLEGI